MAHPLTSPTTNDTIKQYNHVQYTPLNSSPAAVSRRAHVGGQLQRLVPWWHLRLLASARELHLRHHHGHHSHDGDECCDTMLLRDMMHSSDHRSAQHTT